MNHPNIAQIYGLEESDKTRCIVMELAEGDTLQERLKRGPIPLDEALRIAGQIAEALEAAHEKGIIHRDLKPANIKLAPDGNVKVLDFGLAKALQEQQPSSLSNSPTLLSAASTPGMILGTAAYMGPEQARGQNVDHRSDVFSFGCVLYEMLTAKQAFEGGHVSDVLAAVLRADPDWNALPADAGPKIRTLLSRCLEKNPKSRWQASGDLRIEIENILSGPAAEQTQTPASPIVIGNARREWVLGSIAVLAAAAFAVTLLLSPPWRTAAPAAPIRLNSEIGADISVGNTTFAVSPDGSMLAFVSAKNGTAQIYIRRLVQLQALPLAGTSGASSPFFSPDGQWLAFFAEGKLKKISVSGGAAVTLADAPSHRGGSWGDDGNIVFTPEGNTGTSLQRVSSVGGKVEQLTKLREGEATHRWPQVLPDAKAMLYMSSVRTGGSYEDANIIVQPLPSGSPKVLIRGGYYPRYVPSGHLVYIHGGTLFAAPFDIGRLEVTGPSVPAVEVVNASPAGGSAQFAVSSNGILMYLSGQNTGVDSPVIWVSHDGKTAPCGRCLHAGATRIFHRTAGSLPWKFLTVMMTYGFMSGHATR